MADDPNAVVTGGEGQVADPANPVAEGNEAEGQQTEQKPVNWEKRYADSSNEARRLFQEKTELEARLKSLEQTRSLTEQQQQAQAKSFVPREQFVRYWVENGEMTEKAAGLLYERDLADWQSKQFLTETLQAINNRMKFKEEADARLSIERDPEIKTATEFWKDNAAMSALPVGEQLAEYRKVTAKLGATGTTQRRDLTAVKQAAGGSVGGGAGRAPAATAEEDNAARAAGFKNAQAMREMNACRTQADYDAWNAKYNKK